MPPARLRLLSSVDPQQVLDILREWIASAPNVLQATGDRSVRALRDSYLWWEEPKEKQLWAWTHDLATATMFQTEGHWHIRQIASGQPDGQLARDARIEPLIHGELEGVAQVDDVGVLGGKVEQARPVRSLRAIAWPSSRHRPSSSPISSMTHG